MYMSLQTIYRNDEAIKLTEGGSNTHVDDNTEKSTVQQVGLF